MGKNAGGWRALRWKKWLFCGSDRGSRAAAIYFSLLVYCMRHGHVSPLPKYSTEKCNKVVAI
jgi:hypothetical protein